MNINCLFIRHGLTRGLHLLLLAVALGGGALTRAANIVWVTDNSPAGFSALGGTVFAEDGWYTLLTNAGHKVIRFNPPDANATLLTAADFTALNTNDLIILGRSVASGAFQAPQVGGWNSNIFRPLMSINVYLTRAARAGWYSGSTLPNGVPTLLSAYNLADPKTAYIFGGVTMSGTNTVAVYDEAGGQNTSQITEGPVAGGVRIAGSTPTAWQTISDWPSNTLVRAGADRLGGYRMQFSAGLREASGGAVSTAGGENLTAVGENIFLRAVTIALGNGALPNPPSVPANLAGLALSGQVQLTWSPATFAVGYYLKRAAVPGGPYATIATNGLTTSYADFSVVNGTTYYYVVSAFNNSGESANSAEISVTPRNAPANVVATAGTNQILVSWDALAGADTYTVKRSANVGGPFTTIASGLAGTSHLDTPLGNGQTFYYVVVAQLTGGGGDSGQSGTASATTAPGAVTLNTVLFASTVLRLGWTSGGAAISQYLVETSPDGVNFSPLVSVAGSALSYTNSGRSPDTVYCYRVQATNGGGLSPYSNVTTNRTPAFGYNVNISNGGNSSQNVNPAPVPPGYVADEGEIFGDRTNGFFYGWTTVGGTNITRDARRRESAASPDVRYDTLNQFMKNNVNNPATTAIWEFELTNGFYSVAVVGGDAAASDSVFQFDIEGFITPALSATNVGLWAGFTNGVGVSDGRLTIKAGPGAVNHKFCFVDIYPAVATAPSFAAQPQPVTVEQSRPSTLAASVQGSATLAYQWYQNDAPVAGATNPTLSRVHTALGDGGNYYLVATNYGGSATSSVVTLTVTADTTPPYIVSIGSLDGKIIGVQFNEEINPLYVNEPGNFSINGGGGPVAVSAILRPDGRSVKLVLDTPITGAFTVDAYDLTDYSGVFNPLTGTNATVLGFAAGDIGGPVAPGTHVTFDNNFIEMNGGGADFWTTADQGYIATKPITGDFDVRVRVNSLTRPDNVAKAALFARESTAADSAGLHVSVNPPAPGRNQIELTLRPATASNSVIVGASFVPAGIPNAWMRLTRSGSTFTGFRSTNGTDWISLGATSQVFAATLQVGLGVTAHTNGGLIATGTFSGLTISQNANSDVAISKSASTNVIRAGKTVSYLVTVTNAGPDAATNIVVTDTLIGAGLLQAVLPSQGTIAGATPGGFTWNVGTLAPNSAATLSANATATNNQAGLLTNRVVVTSASVDAVPANNSAFTVTTVINPPSPLLVQSGRTNGTFFSSFLTHTSVVYEIQYRHKLPPAPCIDFAPCPGDDPTPWTLLTTITGDGTIKSFTDSTAGTTNRFYRVRFQ